MDGKTRPGQSQSLTVGVRKIVWKCLVWPGVLDTLTTYNKNHNEFPYKNGQKIFITLTGVLVKCVIQYLLSH